MQLTKCFLKMAKSLYILDVFMQVAMLKTVKKLTYITQTLGHLPA